MICSDTMLEKGEEHMKEIDFINLNSLLQNDAQPSLYRGRNTTNN